METRTCWICYAEEEIKVTDSKNENFIDKNCINEKKDQQNQKSTNKNFIKKDDENDNFERKFCKKRSSIDKIESSNLSNYENVKKWVRPCTCKGSLEYVHEACFKLLILHSRSMKCAHCKTKFKIVIKDYYYIKVYEALTSFCLGFLLSLSFLVVCICIYIFLFLYGAALIYTNLGRQAIEKLIYRDTLNGQEFNFSGMARILIGFPLCPISLLFTRPYTSLIIVPIILFILIIEINYIRVHNVVIALLPFLYLFYRLTIDIIKEKIIPNSQSYFTERVYTINSFFAQFPFPAKSGLIALFIPFAGSIVGYFLFSNMHYLSTVLGAFVIFIIFDSSKILYLYMIKRRMEGLRIEDN